MTKPQPRPWTDGDKRYLRQLILDGASVPEIARKMRRTKGAVSAYKHRQGFSAAVVRGDIPGMKMRHCMCCGTVFASQGNHNRLCDRCRSDSGDYSLSVK